MMQRGFTLVECMLASAILGFSCLALFEGIGVFARVSRENAQLLAAEGVAWDAAWKRFNENYDDLTVGETTLWRELTGEAAPALANFDAKAKIKIDVKAMASVGWLADMKVVSVDVEWGPASDRRRLSDKGHDVRICRGNLGRAP